MATQSKFKGGIQKGTTCYDADSRLLDKFARQAKKIVFESLKEKYPLLRVETKLTKDQIPGGVGACKPDGGVWFYEDRLIACFEGKKQNNAGNAVERWFKNNYITKMINPEITYVTFATGEGAKVGNKIYHGLHVAHFGMMGVINSVEPQKNNLHLRPDGFTLAEICDIMTTSLEKTIESI